MTNILLFSTTVLNNDTHFIMVSKKHNGIAPDEQQANFVLKRRQKERMDHVAWYERRKKKEVEQEAVEQYLETKKHIPEKE